MHCFCNVLHWICVFLIVVMLGEGIPEGVIWVKGYHNAELLIKEGYWPLTKGV